MIALYRTIATVAALPFVATLLPPARAFQSPFEITPRVHAELTNLNDDSPPEAHLRLDASIVMVPVQATRSDAPVLGLTSENFKLFENGGEQVIRYFAQDDAPVSVGVLFDSSASMKDKNKKASEAAAAFFRMANTEDEFFLIKFDEKPRLSMPFTTNIAELNHEIDHTRPFGRTSLYDAVHMALDLMKHARHQRRALVIFSDGGDNRSRRNLSSVKSRAGESGIPIYSFGIFDKSETEDDDGSQVLDMLASLTGGRHFPVNLADLPRTSELLGKLLRNEYVLGYQPSNGARDGTYRRITLEVDAPNGPVSLSHRKGYYAPNR